MKYWAKTTKDKLPGKSVISHMRDLQAVAELLLSSKQSLLSSYAIDKKILSYFAGLHDIGKISPGFQMKSPVWLQENNLDREARNNAWNSIHESDHSKVTQYTIQNMLKKNDMQTGAAELWAALLGAHHGRLHIPGIEPRGCKPDDEWENSREATANDLLGSVGLPNTSIDDSWSLAWWFSGLVTIADWISSNEEWFPAEEETTQSQSAKKAFNAVKSIGLDRFEVKHGLSFEDIFGFMPNDIQIKAGESITKPGIYLLEAPMGMGKTEAAIWTAYKLMCSGRASGIYFALPTQTTSNRIYERLQKYLREMTTGEARAHLIHANSWLLEELSGMANNPLREAENWFASKKRALLAPFGVGTVDQALMGIIAVRHFFIRQFALSEKVIVLDEVHSYDFYTGTLIKILCDKLLPLGCTVIVLSATLTREAKKDFIVTSAEKNKDTYPLITGKVSDNNKSVLVQISKPETKNILIEFDNESEALSVAIEKAKHGSKVLWICNTVVHAQKIYNQAKRTADNSFEIGLLHARFPFFRRKELENYWMEKLGKDNTIRKGCILFSTQVVEQSVDLDADFMVSELAPSDMLLQRMGRLWRHPRTARPCPNPEFCIVREKATLEEFVGYEAVKIKEVLGPKAKVYSPYILLRSLELWYDIKSIKIPDDIRKLLEETYKAKKGEPVEWKKLKQEIIGEEFAKKQLASFEANVWNPLLADEEGMAKTRAIEYPMTQLILVKGEEQNRIVFINDETADLSQPKYTLSSRRAIHQNIVKVPVYLFCGKGKNRDISNLVPGNWQMGFIDGENRIKSDNLKQEYMLKYSSEMGVEIIMDNTRRGANYEPRD